MTVMRRQEGNPVACWQIRSSSSKPITALALALLPVLYHSFSYPLVSRLIKFHPIFIAVVLRLGLKPHAASICVIALDTIQKTRRREPCGGFYLCYYFYSYMRLLYEGQRPFSPKFLL